MLGSITPLGERSRGRTWAITVSWYVAGSTAAGAGAGWLLGWLGWAVSRGIGLGIPGRSALFALAGVIAAGAVLDAKLGGTRLPTIGRQVNEDWLQRYRGWVYGVGFGFQLGLGMITIVTISAVYAAFAAALLTGSPSGGAAVGGAFGLIRAATVFGGARVRRTDQLVDLDGRLSRWERPSRRLAIALELALAGTAILLALT
jgi:hypothetical protein